MNLDPPLVDSDRRKQQLIYLRPSLKARIEKCRNPKQESRSVWIERAIIAQLTKEERNKP